jgi:hypothetical protein
MRARRYPPRPVWVTEHRPSSTDRLTNPLRSGAAGRRQRWRKPRPSLIRATSYPPLVATRDPPGAVAGRSTLWQPSQRPDHWLAGPARGLCASKAWGTSAPPALNGTQPTAVRKGPSKGACGMAPFVVGVLKVFVKVSISPSSGGLPGTSEAEKVISGLMFRGLLACVAGGSSAARCGRCPRTVGMGCSWSRCSRRPRRRSAALAA